MNPPFSHPRPGAAYDKNPAIAVPGSGGAAVTGWDEIAARLRDTIDSIRAQGARKIIVAIECYAGVDDALVETELARRLNPALSLNAGAAMLAPAEIDRLIAPFLGGDDPEFGFLGGLALPQFFSPEKTAALRARVEAAAAGVILVTGCGALHVAPLAHVLVYADLARREAQLRHRRNETPNLGADNKTQAANLKHKRAFFIDWRVCDRWKRPLISRWDFVLDTHDPRAPKLADGGAVRRGLRHAVTRPFRVVPFFDPGPWGGQWMREVFDLGRAAKNFAWCFDCVPEENSLCLDLGGARLEIPSIDLVFDQPRALLGEKVHARFGDEFPIRFDLLDSMGGGNLSFQVHPLTEYIQRHFGMHYTQDESYYYLDAAPGAEIFLGLRDGVTPAALARDLRAAQNGGAPFPGELCVRRYPVKKHDHFLIPAGTCHCSGAGGMVLEISATPYIFTFKMWDWGRPGLDGKPRPLNIERGLANIQWDRDEAWVRAQLVNRVTPLGAGNGWREERTGLHEREFIETRRHWFLKTVPHHTHGGVNVLNLVEGHCALVESPDNAFEPCQVNYAETFIVPAAVNAYTIRPLDPSPAEHATIKAFVRA
jgi:mannose-6-phosphate isomerase class I